MHKATIKGIQNLNKQQAQLIEWDNLLSILANHIPELCGEDYKKVLLKPRIEIEPRIDWGGPTIFCWNCSIEDHVYPLLATIRRTFNCYYEMFFSEYAGQLYFYTKIKGHKVIIVVIGATDCKITRTKHEGPTYTLHCGGDNASN